MKFFMHCSVKQPTECKEFIVYDEAAPGWEQVVIPRSGMFTFCPNHRDAFLKASEISFNKQYEIDTKDWHDRRIREAPYRCGKQPTTDAGRAARSGHLGTEPPGHNRR